VLQELGRLTLALGALFAAWTVPAAWTALRTGRNDFLAAARRGAVAATACAVAAAALLVVALWRGDLAVAFVAGRWSVLVPARFVPAALLSDPGGALPAWAALGGTAGLVALRAAGVGLAARAWGTVALGGALLVPLALAAVVFQPFADAPASAFDGAGLAPDLQRLPAVAHAIGLVVGAALSVGPFVLSVAAMGGRTLGEGWSKAVRPWNAAVFAALIVGVAAGARWYALAPLRGEWIGYRGAPLWLMTTAIAAWLAWLDHGRQPADRVVMRLLLVTGTFVASTMAVAMLGGAVLRSVSDAAPPAGAFALAVVPVAALALVLRLVAARGGALGALRGIPTPTGGPAASAGAWLARSGAILVIGAAAGAYAARSHTLALGDTEIFRARDPFGHQWSFRSQGVSTLRRENYGSLTLAVVPERDGRRRPHVLAESRNYFRADDSDAGPTSATAGVATGVFLETRIAVVEADRIRPTIHVRFVPLASWLVPGALLLAVGALLGALPATPPGPLRSPRSVP
jgi:cytochrome c biogenesis factor